MTLGDMLVDAFGRIRGAMSDVLSGLTPEQLEYQAGDSESNTIAWLVWHLVRVQDDHIAAAAGIDQVWTSKGWYERFGLPLEPSDTGYGHTPAQVAVVRAPVALLLAYHQAVFEQTIEFVQGLCESDLDRIVDQSWDPPVTLGVRLVSVIADDLQHTGQAALIRGLAERS